MQKEINVLRMQLANRAEEIDKLKMSKLFEVDRAREEGYNRCEQRFIATMKAKEAKYQEEKAAGERQLAEAVKEETARYNRLYMTSFFTKWRLIVQISKLKTSCSTGDSNADKMQLDEILGAI